MQRGEGKAETETPPLRQHAVGVCRDPPRRVPVSVLSAEVGQHQRWSPSDGRQLDLKRLGLDSFVLREGNRHVPDATKTLRRLPESVRSLPPGGSTRPAAKVRSSPVRPSGRDDAPPRTPALRSLGGWLQTRSGWLDTRGVGGCKQEVGGWTQENGWLDAREWVVGPKRMGGWTQGSKCANVVPNRVCAAKGVGVIFLDLLDLSSAGPQ